MLDSRRRHERDDPAVAVTLEGDRPGQQANLNLRTQQLAADKRQHGRQMDAPFIVHRVPDAELPVELLHQRMRMPFVPARPVNQRRDEFGTDGAARLDDQHTIRLGQSHPYTGKSSAHYQLIRHLYAFAYDFRLQSRIQFQFRFTPCCEVITTGSTIVAGDIQYAETGDQIMCVTHDGRSSA